MKAKFIFLLFLGFGLWSSDSFKARAADTTFFSGTNWQTATWSPAAFPSGTSAGVLFTSNVGTLSGGANVSVSIGPSNITTGTMTISNNTGASVTINNNSSGTLIFQTGAPANFADLILLGSGTGLNQIAAPILLNSGLFVTTSNVNAQTSLYVSGHISGVGGFIKRGAGTLLINAGNTFSGGFSNSGGTVITGGSSDPSGASGPLGTGRYTPQSNTTLRSLDVTSRTYYNALNLTGGIATYGSAGTGAQTFSGAFGGTAVLQFSTTFNTVSNLTISQNIAGSGGVSVTKVGAATLTLSGSNTGVSAFVVNAGVLEFAGASPGVATPFLSADYFTVNGATIRFSASPLATLVANAGFTLGSGGGTIEVTAGVVVKEDGKFSESSPGSALIKTGSGTLYMNAGTSTYTGATTVSQGTLIIGTGAKLATTNVTVASGATLGGGGAVGGTLTVNGILTPGVSSETEALTVANSMILGSTAVVAMRLGGGAVGAYDQVVQITDLTLDGTIVVSLFNGYDPGYGATFYLLDFDTMDASGFSILSDLILPNLDSGLSWDRSSFLSAGSISVIPEPTISALLISAVALILAGRPFFRSLDPGEKI